MIPRRLLGLDLGQRQDPTATAVVECAEVDAGFDPVRYVRRTEKQFALRHLERMMLGTPYTEVARRVRSMVETLKNGGPGEFGGLRWYSGTKVTVVADATGVGAPVIDMLREARLGCELAAVTITAGDRATRSPDGWRVPKRDLVAGVQVMLEEGKLRIASRLRWEDALVNELRTMRVKMPAPGQEQFAAWREGEHDDLVLAVALACWRAKMGEVGEMGRALGVET